MTPHRAGMLAALALTACTVTVTLRDSPGACVACRLPAPGAPASASAPLQALRERLREGAAP
jgi:hypothetical protein